LRGQLIFIIAYVTRQFLIMLVDGIGRALSKT